MQFLNNSAVYIALLVIFERFLQWSEQVASSHIGR